MGKMRPPAVAQLDTGPGVYRFRDVKGRVLYVGRAVNLRRRVASYWGDLGDRRHLRRMVPQIDRIEAVACDSDHEAAWLERNLLERSLPRWNRTRGGQETPAYITLQRSGLEVAYERRDGAATRLASAAVSAPRSAAMPSLQCGARRSSREDQLSANWFGPYLGSARVRTAISGLHRVLPLGYTGERLTGTERDMARIRGVVPGDRAEIVRTITAVLDRDPAAVAALRGELARRRDVAAAALAFEHAAGIQDEIEAVDWVCAPQNVARDEPVTATITGWSNGIVVRFDIRDGRMSSWIQHPGSEPIDVAATPAEWLPFARRNAELAARLAAA